MDKSKIVYRPLAQSNDLVLQEIDGEALIYNLNTHKIYNLNKTAYTVWRHCDGKKSTYEIAAQASRDIGADIPHETVVLALATLHSQELLVDTPIPQDTREQMRSRRELIKRAGLSAAVALPAVLIATMPKAAHAQSGKPIGASCTLDTECQSTCCFNNVCSPVELCNI